MERGLAAILAVDIVGYGSFKGDEEAGMLAALKATKMVGQDLAIWRRKG